MSAPAVQALRHCNEMELLEDCERRRGRQLLRSIVHDGETLAQGFQRMDVNGDGEVTAAELAAVGCPSSIIEELLSLCDTNHDGQISFGEFLALAKVEDEISALQDEILYSEIKDVPCGSGGAHLEPACDEAMLTLRPADGTTVQVPLLLAADESELVRNLLEDVDGSSRGTVLHIPWLDGEQAMAFAAFLHGRVEGTHRASTGNINDGDKGSFTALYDAASYLIAPQWQQQLADSLGSLVVKLAATMGHEAVNAWARREEATLDPDVSPILTMLSSMAVATLLIATSRQPDHIVTRWADCELGKPERRAEGWMVVPGSSKPDRASVIHIVIRPGTTTIHDWDFHHCLSLVSVAIPDSVTQIGAHAFSGCSSLASVAIPGSVTQIDKYAFSACLSLVSVAIPDSVTQIGAHAFSECLSLASVAIPDSVTQIGYGGFCRCLFSRDEMVALGYKYGQEVFEEDDESLYD